MFKSKKFAFLIHVQFVHKTVNLLFVCKNHIKKIKSLLHAFNFYKNDKDNFYIANHDNKR